MFLKGAFRRSSNKKSGYRGGSIAKKATIGDDIFRGGTASFAKEGESSIDHVLTMTMTEDEEDTKSLISTNAGSPAHDVSEATVLLADIEQSQPIADDEEQSGLVTFTEAELMQHELEHMRQVSALEQELRLTRSEIEGMKASYQKQLKSCELELELKEMFLQNTRQELSHTKQELKNVASTLMQAQDELYETKGSWSIFDFSW